jgi:DNA polymerase
MTITTVTAELQRLAHDAEACRNCALGDVRTRAVFGVGSPTADLMFVGEAPGYHEDQKGEPFVGAAGQLLTRLIETKLGLKRADVYIANCLKCRPPGNRDPRPDEVEACSPFLSKQVELVDPRVIVALGNFAAHLLTGTQTGISRLRGRRFTYEGRALLCTYHPAAALRGGAAAQGIAEDFELIKAALHEVPEAAVDAGTQLDLFA